MTYIDKRIDSLIQSMNPDEDQPHILVWYGKYGPIQYGIVDADRERILKAYVTIFDAMVVSDFLGPWDFEEDIDGAKLWLKATSGDYEAKMEVVLSITEHEYMRTEMVAIQPLKA